MTKKKAINGLYLITPGGPTEKFLPIVAYALQKGVGTVQYRNKDKAPKEKRTDLQALMALMPRHALIVNDDIRLAHELGLGVHLGKEDGDIAKARALLGDQAIIGASCYNDLDKAQHALATGADYLAFGSVFASPTKTDAVSAPLSIFAKAKTLSLDTPLVAIGGITPKNARFVFEAGADAIAVISAVFAAPDPYLAIDQFLEVIHAISF